MGFAPLHVETKDCFVVNVVIMTVGFIRKTNGNKTEMQGLHSSLKNPISSLKIVRLFLYLKKTIRV